MIVRKTILINLFSIIFSLIFCIFLAVGEIKYFDAAGNNISESEWNEIVKQGKKLTQKENPSNDENSSSPNYGNNNKGSITNDDQSKINKTKRNASVVKKRDTSSVSKPTVAKKSSDIHVVKDINARNDMGNTQTSNQSLGSAGARPQISEAERQPAIAKTQAPINRAQRDELLTFIVICTIGLLLFLTVRYAIRKRNTTQKGKDSTEASEAHIRDKVAPIYIINLSKEKSTPQKSTINITAKVGDAGAHVGVQKTKSDKHLLKTRENSKPVLGTVNANTTVVITGRPELQLNRIKRCQSRGCDTPAASGSDYCYDCRN